MDTQRCGGSGISRASKFPEKKNPLSSNIGASPSVLAAAECYLGHFHRGIYIQGLFPACGVFSLQSNMRGKCRFKKRNSQKRSREGFQLLFVEGIKWLRAVGNRWNVKPGNVRFVSQNPCGLVTAAVACEISPSLWPVAAGIMQRSSGNGGLPRIAYSPNSPGRSARRGGTLAEEPAWWWHQLWHWLQCWAGSGKGWAELGWKKLNLLERWRERRLWNNEMEKQKRVNRGDYTEKRRGEPGNK